PVPDWRQGFYWMVDSSNNRKRLDDNNVLWNPDGTMKPPGTGTSINGTTWTVQINYDAVLYWIKNTGPTGNLFPTNVRSGRMLYYSAIPTSIASPPGDLNERFWKEYIDYVFGWRDYTTTTSGSYTTTTLLSGYGTGFSWSTATYPQKIYAKPYPGATGTAAVMNTAVDNPGGYSSGYSGPIKILAPSVLNWTFPNEGDMPSLGVLSNLTPQACAMVTFSVRTSCS